MLENIHLLLWGIQWHQLLQTDGCRISIALEWTKKGTNRGETHRTAGQEAYWYSYDPYRKNGRWQLTWHWLWHQNHYHFFPDRVLQWFLLNYLNFVHAARLVILHSAKQNQYLMFTIYTNYSPTNTWLLYSVIIMGSKCITSWEITILFFWVNIQMNF